MNLMGRAKILWSHTRDIRVDVSKSLIKYTIPTEAEGNSRELGAFIRAEKREGEVVIYFQRIQEAEVSKMPSSDEDPYTITF